MRRKKITDFPNYEVTEKGDVISLEYNGEKGFSRKISQRKTKEGYVRYRLSKNGKFFDRMAHRLVADTFIPNPENKKKVFHKDGNFKNNQVSNLEWI